MYLHAMRGIKQWPFVSFSIAAEDLEELDRLARSKGYSRAELLRRGVHDVVLPYARAMGPSPLTRNGRERKDPAA